MSQSKPTLAIGHHLLEGKIVSLPKPLGVIQRCTVPDPSIRDAHDHEYAEIGGRKLNELDAGSTTWDMVAIVKKKIVFSKRPMPIVGAAAMSANGNK